MIDPRIVALFFVAGWPFTAISIVMRIPRIEVERAVYAEARRLGHGAFMLSEFRRARFEYQAMIEREQT
jgi:hypothetical protein